MQKRWRDLSSRMCAILLRQSLAAATALRSRFSALLLACSLFAVPSSLYAIDGSAVVSGGGTVSFTGASSTNWVKGASGSLDLLLVYTNAEEAAASFAFDGLTSARILAVGGGGGGGGAYKLGFSGNYGGGGGGGAGGFVEVTNLYSAATYIVNVGAGGDGGTKGNTSSANCDGKDGGDTTVSTNGTAMITAFGGGGGGSQSVGHAGASGGGGSMKNSGAAVNAGGQPKDAAQGHAGGSGDKGMFGGGGGGAGKMGTGASSENPIGGEGRPSDIAVDFGAADIPWYAGGGGGSHSDKSITKPTARIAGGKGGGGQGGVGKGSGAAAMGPTAGEDGTGGGGGGCDANTTGTGAKGGSGAVIVRIEGSGLPSKPKDAQYLFDGKVHYAVTPSPFVEIVSGQNAATESGSYVVTAKPIEGMTWKDDGTADPVVVTMTIYDGEEEVTGAPIRYFGASNVTRVKDEDGNENLLLEFREKGGYILPGASSARILAVGGGGGGGGAYKLGFSGNYGGGGGGGAGGFVEVTNLYGAATYVVNVGAGGDGGTKGNTSSANCDGKDGGDTTVSTNGTAMITAFGGGGGGSQSVGHAGGSGGGGSMKNSGAAVNAGGQPKDAAQGHAGGSGDKGMFGGGGGGAGGVGGDASSLNPTGGVGRASDIAVDFGTADLPWYAGGGGGSHSDKSITTPTGRIAGGKGGGGDGGVGKGSGAAAMGPTAGEDGTGGGGGGCDATTTGTGAKGGSGIVYVRISSAMKGEFKKPDPYVEYTYDREEHVAIQPFAFYEISGENVRTNAGTYHATATLKPEVPSWPDGTTGPATTEMNILKRPVTVTDLHIDGWTYGDEVTPEPTCTVNPGWAPLVYEWKGRDEDVASTWKKWDEVKPTHAGTYELRVRLADKDNYEFAAGGEPDPVEFTIGKLDVTFSELRLRSWMFGTPDEDVPQPSCTVVPGWVVPVYQWRGVGEGVGVEWNDWSLVKPAEVGAYELRAGATNEVDYAFDYATCEFSIFGGLGNIFTDYVEITVTNPTDDTLVNYPFAVTLCETNPPGPVGFSYTRAGTTGDDLAFTDREGTMTLDYSVGLWDTNGVSTLYVKVPELAAHGSVVLRLYWNVRPGEDVPPHHPGSVWDDWKDRMEEWQRYIAVLGFEYAAVYRDGKFVNYWTKLPKIDPDLWTAGETPGKLQDAELAFGTVRRTITNLVTGATYAKIEDIPATVGGNFRVIYAPDDPLGEYEPLEEHVGFSILIDTWFDNLRGDAATPTLAGRVLLANNDAASGHEILDQAYWQTREVDRGDGTKITNDVYWTHGGTEHGTYADDKTVTHMLGGTDHWLHYWEGGTERTLWRLQDVILGNAVRNDKIIYVAQCVLPWSTNGLGNTSYADRNKKGDMLEAGNLILRNKASACVYSPCYTNGIGTIYFDALNGSNNEGDRPFHIVVEMATETKEHKAPTDENAKDETLSGINGELAKITNEQWKPCAMLPFYYDGTTMLPCGDGTMTNDFVLACHVESSTKCYYRICVPINYKEPVRFRIRRLYANEASGRTADNGSLILLDNILVSYPQMSADLEPYGVYDGERRLRETLGWGGAFVSPFPSVTDAAIYGRGKMTPYVSAATNADARGFIAKAYLHYQWRYLDQASNGWDKAVLEPGDGGFATSKPLEGLPRQEGDLEFWYEGVINAPYYRYYDYSGTDADLGGFYSEARTAVTNRLSAAKNWFVRLRDGASDCEGWRMFVKESADGPAQKVEMEIASDRLWRGYVQTLRDSPATNLYVRFEAYNRQVPGATAYATNVHRYVLQANVKDLSVPTSLTDWRAAGVPVGPDDWSTVVRDAKTGYLLFQVAEKTLAATIVHADRQDFNRWSDANRDGIFFGAAWYTNDNASGTSPRTRDFEERFADWPVTLATNKYWHEGFDVSKAQMTTPGGYYEVFQPFGESRQTPNGWSTGPGEWVTSFYRDLDSGMALQMEGKGKGYIQFVNGSETPDGLEYISFNARIGQAIDFGDFSYFDGDKKSLTKYTFFCRGCYDINQRRSFSGNATLSLVAFYRAGEGCYELRVEQENAKYTSDKVSGAGNDQRLSLYRWSYDEESGEIVATNLGSTVITKEGMLTTASEYGSYANLFISAENTGTQTKICAGVSHGVASISSFDTAQHRWVSYIDASAARLRNGTYGVLSANCPARFRHLFYSPTATTLPISTANKFDARDQNFSFPGSTSRSSCMDDLVNGGWSVQKRRMEVVDDTDSSNFGLKAKEVSQTLYVYTAPAGSTEFDTQHALTNVTISNFGTVDSVVIPLWTTAKRSVKIAAGGTSKTVRTDVVIDDITLRRWHGATYDVEPESDYFEDTRYGSPTNFVYTQGWNMRMGELDETYRVCRLSAKRSNPDEPTSIRSPLFDGENGRGKGLGMISFTYERAQTNVNLLVQIATNGISRTTFAETTRQPSDSPEWTTVTNLCFFAETNATSGSFSCYLGLHDVVGAMRLVLDRTNCVEAVTNSTDEASFGEIDITGVLCRDEPKLDGTSWWGWNLRTTDEDDQRYLRDETPDGLGRGLSFALNNSLSDDVNPPERDAYPQNLPFLQTPAFDPDTVGEISFKVRKYRADDAGVAHVALYGARQPGAPAGEWRFVTSWDVGATLYTNLTYRTEPGKAFAAFRLAVTGVAGVKPEGQMDPTHPDPGTPANPLRILIDEVTVMDAVRARIAFRNTAAFRNHLDTNRAIIDILSRTEQPLCREAFGVQTEIYPAQLAEEVDLSTAKVRLWWYPDDDVWGWQNWTNRPASRSAWLAACEGTNLVFRSSYPAARDAVIDPLEQAGVVQYALEVVYRTEGVEKHDWIERTDWEKPAWYHPVDFNRDRADEGFSPFTILDEVAPGYAWINEVNMYDGPNEFDDISKTNQYVEVAVPSEADLTGWRLQFVTGGLGDGSSWFTNNVVRFGDEVDGTKSVGGASNYVFITAGNPQSCTDATRRAGTIDGAWTVRGYSSEQSQLNADGSINPGFPIGIQLVRPSGIIEHQIVIAGTNSYADIPAYAWQFSATNFLANLKKLDPESQWVFPGEDTGDNPYNSQSATNQFGRAGMWRHETKTPGRINGGEWIDPDHPTPQGESIILYANLEGGHVWQASGRYESTTKNLVLYVPKGGAGTDIVYRVDHWYELGRVTENGKEVPGLAGRGADGSPVVFTAAVGASNNVTVVASARIATDLREKYGLTDRNPYTPAVMAWLEGGETLRGAFADPYGEVKLADTHCFFSDNFITNMTLTEMYWLDMDPTVGGLVLRIGAQATGQHEVPGEPGTTNVDIYAYMMMSNKADAVTYTPYTLRGIEPGDLSHEYAGVWTAETFRVTGTLLGRSDVVDLSYYTFGPNSFHEDGSCHINLDYPYDPPSPGFYHGWGAHRGTTIGYWLRLDANVLPIAPRILTPAD